MLDPDNITKYNRTTDELEELILFWLFAAGHNAHSTAKGVDKFIQQIGGRKDLSLFKYIELLAKIFGWDLITQSLRNSGLGCWRIKSRTIRELVESNLDLHTCSVEELESIWGIGPKTARCFILHSRKGVRLAGLDVHILRYLKNLGYNVPVNTPVGKRYREIEEIFLSICDQIGKSPAEYDLEIWKQSTQKA
jgi:thermostable 8-oxoguanine DNA glycosylase